MPRLPGIPGGTAVDTGACVSLMRLRPLAAPSVGGRLTSTCAACGKSATAKHRPVHMYGQVFHSACAYPGGKRGEDRR